MNFKFPISNFKCQITLLLVTSYLLLVTPAHAQVPIKDYFGFGDIKSLGQGTTRIVIPMFEIAAFLVIFYFLLGAFRFLRAGGNKEEAEGGRQMINHAIIGFILLMFVYLLFQFIPDFFNLPGIDIIR